MNLSIGGVWGDGKKISQTKNAFFRKKIPFSRPKFQMTFFQSSTMIFGYFLFSISLLPVMSYLTLSSQEKPLFQTIIPSRNLFYSVRAFAHFARVRQTLYFSEYYGTDAWTVTPSQILGGPSPSPLQVSARESITLIILKMCVSLVGAYMLLSLFYKLFHNLRIMAHSSVVVLILNNLYLVKQLFFQFFHKFL